jgi:hypothetical protein
MVVSASLEILAVIGNREVRRDEVQEWESERVSKVARKLGIGPLRGSLVERRQALVQHKLELGHEAIEARLAWELRLSAGSSRMMSALSRGRRRVCTVELSGPVGAAEAMPGFYRQAIDAGDEAPLLIASPDHFLLGRRPDGLQQVIETTGGAPLASRIFLDESDIGTVKTAADPDFPVQWVAVGRAGPSGPVAGGLRHQFREGPDGFRARLTIEFPALTPARIVHGHRRHLACEFSNWIEAASEACGPRS